LPEAQAPAQVAGSWFGINRIVGLDSWAGSQIGHDEVEHILNRDGLVVVEIRRAARVWKAEHAAGRSDAQESPLTMGRNDDVQQETCATAARATSTLSTPQQTTRHRIGLFIRDAVALHGHAFRRAQTL
jgi:hypothetical protein